MGSEGILGRIGRKKRFGLVRVTARSVGCWVKGDTVSNEEILNRLVKKKKKKMVLAGLTAGSIGCWEME